MLIIGLVAVTIMLSAACTILLVRFHQTDSARRRAPFDQVQTLTAKLGKTLTLPNEQPSLVTVLNHTKLGDTRLIQEARNGDQLLIFAHAKQVILYRPTTSKVVDMFHVEAPLTSSSR